MTRQTENIPISDIFRKYQSQLKSFISKRVPSKEDCEDILQNVFYQLLKTDSEGTVIGQVSAWLYSVARNQIIDRSRKHTEEPMPYKQGEDSEGRFMNEISGQRGAVPAAWFRRSWTRSQTSVTTSRLARSM